jgi:hypothetical protein|tara:strand:- start:4155 stop:4313 length:159 start_codon:yes stop_codon:yes gene_type:complete
MINEPLIWVGVGIFSFLILAVIKNHFYPRSYPYISDNMSDTTADMSDIESNS